MPQKIRDVAVKTGTYQDNQGNEKGRWQNVGALMKGDDGGEFIILHRWFNPAGVPNPQDRDSVVLSCFSVKDKQQSGGAPAPANDPPAQDWDDDIPFITAWSAW